MGAATKKRLINVFLVSDVFLGAWGISNVFLGGWGITSAMVYLKLQESHAAKVGYSVCCDYFL